MTKESLVGKQFGRLRVIALAHPKTLRRGTFWLCLCRCGKKTIVRRDALIGNKTTSCGCFGSKRLAETRGWFKHGHAPSGHPSREYRTWTSMKHRCNNPHDKCWASYGGKGIVVCDRWENSFNNFLEDMGPCPDGMQIDRIDNSKGYEPSNCRWTSGKINCNNKRNNHTLTFCGETHTVTEWARIRNIPVPTLFSRIYLGWSVSDALLGKE